ncbi:MAG: ABC transporter ATP-binding protein [Prevotella sp.]|nr:ABC transporter ATP-binding protein [Prevotella sp.]
MQKYKNFFVITCSHQKKSILLHVNVKTSDKMNDNISVTLNDLTIGYKNKQGTRVVAEHLTANIHQGCLTCLLGENGVGKSTLLKTLSAFQAPLDGSVCVLGRELSTYSERELARTIGIVLTEKPDVQQMTAMELVEMGRAPYTGFWGRLNDDDRKACEEAMTLIDIGHLKNRMIETLSDGERQKVMIAKTLAQQTPIIYLDEPTAFLDYPSKVDMLLLLSRISREAQKTVFLSTHDLELALQMADEIWLMTHADGIQIGTPQKLAQNGALSAFVERSPEIAFETETLSVRVGR